jgi:acyl-CoA synthetase (AMP-forming)/AMP-acid ligase II
VTGVAAADLACDTLPEALRRRAREAGDRVALADAAAELAYADLDALVDELAARLRRAGLVPGERLALLGANRVEWVAAFLAGLRVGAVVVPLNTRLSAAELRRQIRVCAPRALLADESLLGAVESAAPAAYGLGRGSGRRSVWALRGRVEASASPPPDAPALVAFTSGTTGEPRGAVISHSALVRSASSFVPRLETGRGDSTLTLAPLFHNTGFADQLTQLLLVGGRVDLLAQFGVSAALDALARRPASYLIAVPGVLRLLMLHERADDAFGSCRVAVYGGSPMPVAWIAELAERWPRLRLLNCYGLTEFTSVSHLLDPELALERADSVGRPVDRVRQRIVDGEIQLAGPMRMSGYWRSEAATRAAFDGDWLRTGDLGSIDEDGFLVVAGRVGDVINRGGEKIHAAQVEAALSRLDSVADAVVVAAPHPIFHERVVACVVARDGRDFDEDAARAHLGGLVADYAIPERFVLVDELPRNAAGKVDRARVAAEVRSLVQADER